MKIGITIREIEVNGKQSYILYKRYMEFYGNHEFIIISPGQSEEILNLCDAFIITGGDDLNPKLYNECVIDCSNINDDIDELDFSIINHCVKFKKRLLGICRGIQSINVYFKGSLNQHIDGHMCKKNYINLIEKSRYIDEVEKQEVNSYHHQSINNVGENLKVIFKSDDGVIEMIEHETCDIIGVQFHPEIDLQNKFYKKILSFISLK